MSQVVQRQQVWDLPTRAFHWLLVGLFGFSWWCAENHHLDWHLYSGIAICGLMLFRIMWGLIGSETARFGSFVKGPQAVRSYLRTPGRGSTIGHNPLGGWSVVAMLLLLTAQVVSGLFAVDIDGIELGPFSYLLDFDQGRVVAKFHHTTFDVLLALVALHIAAILFYLIAKGRNLTALMFKGFEPVAAGGAVRAVQQASRGRLIAALIFAALLTYGIANGFRFY